MPMLTTFYADEQLAIVATQAGGGGAVAGPLDAVKLHLAVADFSPTKLIGVGDITQPTTTTFNPPALTWSAPYEDATGDIVTLSDRVLVQSADGTAIMVYGYMLQDTGATHAIMSERFASPMSLPNALAGFNLQIPFAPSEPGARSAYIN